MKKKNANSLGIHRRKSLLRICHHLGLQSAPMWSNRDIIYALADARGIELGLSHIANAGIIIAWFTQNEPAALLKVPKKEKEPSKHQRTQEFYRSWEWRTLRMEVLKQHGFACQCCGAKRGDMAMSGEPIRICVDHIQPLARHWDRRLDRANLQVLCDECNQGKGAWDETDHRAPAGVQ